MEKFRNLNEYIINYDDCFFNNLTQRTSDCDKFTQLMNEFGNLKYNIFKSNNKEIIEILYRNYRVLLTILLTREEKETFRSQCGYEKGYVIKHSNLFSHHPEQINLLLVLYQNIGYWLLVEDRKDAKKELIKNILKAITRIYEATICFDVNLDDCIVERND